MAALPLVTVHAALAVVWRAALERSPGLAPVLFAAAFAALAWSYRRLVRTPGPASPAVSPAGILLVALVLRLLALPLEPVLSNDVHRYLWDGRVALAGENPYRLAPDAPELAPLRDERWQRIDHRGVATVYPPLALALFAIAEVLPAPLLALKALLAGIDLAGCAALLALARRLGVPSARAVWYAWSPLAVIETAGMGHVDALGVAAAVAAALWVVRSRAVGAGAFAAAGALAKLAPLLALPAWARQSRRPATLVGVAGGCLLVALLPVVAATGGMPSGLVTYGVSWEFDGPLYEPLHRGLGALGAGEAAKAGLDAMKAATGVHDLWNRAYPFAYPRFLAKLVLAALLAAAVVRSVRDPRPAAMPGALFAAALLTSATVYPWYLLWVLPWAALALHPGWLLAAATAPFAYLAAAPGAPISDAFPWIWLGVWGPPAVLALRLPRARRWAPAEDDR